MSIEQPTTERVIRAWAFFDEDGILLDILRTKPRKVNGGYQSAWHAMGYKPERVTVVREKP